MKKRIEAMRRWQARYRANRDVVVHLTQEEADALNVAVSCLSYAVHGDLDAVRESYVADETGMRQNDLTAALRVGDHLRSVCRFLRERDLDYLAAFPQTDWGAVEDFCEDLLDKD